MKGKTIHIKGQDALCNLKIQELSALFVQVLVQIFFFILKLEIEIENKSTHVLCNCSNIFSTTIFPPKFINKLLFHQMKFFFRSKNLF